MTTMQPDNLNPLSPLNFRFVIEKAPTVNYFIQSVSIPNLSIGRADVPSPFVKMPIAGDHLEYGELQISFQVDEEMRNYKELHAWMVGIAFPNSFADYTDWPSEFRYSDLSVSILSSQRNPIHTFTFVHAWPTSLSELTFATTSPDVNYLTATASFAYQTFKIRSVN